MNRRLRIQVVKHFADIREEEETIFKIAIEKQKICSEAVSMYYFLLERVGEKPIRIIDMCKCQSKNVHFLESQNVQKLEFNVQNKS